MKRIAILHYPLLLIITMGLFSACMGEDLLNEDLFPNGQRDDSCDDGNPAMCMMAEPDCGVGIIAALRDGCWVCVDPETCE